MPEGATSWLIGAAVVLFVVYLVVKSRVSLVPQGPEVAEAKRSIAEAKRRARESAGDAKARARAWRDAATAALEGLHQPSLAASFARRAERADPDDAEALGVLALALRKSARLSALERLLWRRLAADSQRHGLAYERALDELIKLYEGPLRRSERARVLRDLRARGGSPPSSTRAT